MLSSNLEKLKFFQAQLSVESESGKEKSLDSWGVKVCVFLRFDTGENEGE